MTMKYLSTVIVFTERIFELLLILLLIEITGIISISVFSRYFLNAPIYWAEEVTRYSFVWATFIGAGCAFRRRELVSMSILFNALPPFFKKWLLFILELVMFFFLAAATIYGVNMVAIVFPQLAVATRISMSYLYIVIPISCGFMLMCSLENLLTLIKGDKPVLAWGEDF